MNHKWLNLTHWSDFFFSSRTLHVFTSNKLKLAGRVSPQKNAMIELLADEQIADYQAISHQQNSSSYL